MHTGLEYGVQRIHEELLNESPKAKGFLDKNGQWNNKSKKKMYVYENEGAIPHCHIVGLGSDGNKEVCVRLDKPEYFCHGGKQEKFTKDEKKMFIKFISSKDNVDVVRWNWAVSTWNGFGDDFETMAQITIKNIPDYNKLPTED